MILDAIDTQTISIHQETRLGKVPDMRDVERCIVLEDLKSPF